MLNNLPILDKSALFELLSNRSIEDNKKLSHIPDPALLQDATKAARRIATAILNKQKITLVGDYDVDGVTSTAIMVDFFRQIPYPLEAIIPNRFSDGYGVSPNVLKRVEADLVITVDNGITAIEAAEVCKEKGMDLIITDHHTPSEVLPDAYAIVDPKLPTCNYPFKDICGAEVAWLLLGLVKRELRLNIDMRQFLDILAIAIIADVMPLVDINRTLVKEGLKLMMHSFRPSSIIIRDFLNKSQITSEDIGFQIAPRINSAGRLEDASIALEFFTADTTNKAYKQFELLGKLNEFRKATEFQTTQEAIKQVKESDKIIVVSGEEWHEGVVGIVASRLVDKFSKPAIVLSQRGNIAKGSARSIGEINIYELIKEHKSLLTKFGGHKMAAGLSIPTDKIDTFRQLLNQMAQNIADEDFEPKEQITGIISSEAIDFELLMIQEQFEPFGEANHRPIFMMKNADILNIKTLGRDKAHCKIELKQFSHDRKTFELILFHHVLEMPEDKKLTCSYTIAKNEFNGRQSLQMLVKKIY